MPMLCHSLNTLNTHFVKKIKTKALLDPFWNFLESLGLALDKRLTKQTSWETYTSPREG